MSEADSLHRIDCLIWVIIAAIGTFVLAAGAASHFVIVWPTFVLPLGCAALMWSGSWYYRRVRGELRIATGLGGTAQMIAFTAVGAPLSYIAASANFPLQDHMFDAIDRALGLDWKALLGWMNAWSSIHLIFTLTYLSFIPQVLVTVMALAFTGRLIQLRVFMLALILSAVVCIAVSAIAPAEGVWGYYKVTTADHTAIMPATRELHLQTFFGLRDGSFRRLTGMDSEGIITFPSLHAALGLIFIVALWSLPVLRWIGLVVNGLMIAATPIDGGHYFIDVFVGLFIAVLCIAAANLFAHWLAANAGRSNQIALPQPLRAAE